MKTLVAYFTAEKGKTAELAKCVCSLVNGDLFQIEPYEPYSKADLNYLNPLSRVNKEKIGGADIAIKGLPEGFEQYDCVLVGFPIWYGGAPNIVNCFCEKLDFTGKKVGVFASSIASGIGKSAEKLAPYVNGGSIVGAARFAEANEEEIKNWLAEISK